MVVEKKWKQITEITIITSPSHCKVKPPPIVISAKDAKKVILRSVDFCNALKVPATNTNGDFVVTFGPFEYKLQNVTIDHMLQFLAEIATEITEIEFRVQPKTELLQLLFAKNKIKRVKVQESKDFWKDIPTEGIEHLDFMLSNPDVNLKSFEGLFPNLKTIAVDLDYMGNWPHMWLHMANYEKVLLRILPFVPNIKSLELGICFRISTDVFLNDILKFPHLEEFSLEVSSVAGESLPSFHVNLAESFPALRSLTLKGVEVKDRYLKSLMSLQNLEKLDVTYSTDGFVSIDKLPEMKKLCEFSITFDKSPLANMANLYNAVEKMPKLKRLHVGFLSEEQTLELTCKAIIMAKSQKKDVVVEKTFAGITSESLKVEHSRKSESDDEKYQILSLGIRNYSKTYFDDVTAFVRRTLKDQRVFKLDKRN